MLTPKFTADQNSDFILLRIHCPHIRTNDVEFAVDGSEFLFYAKPYFLKLNFPKELVEDGNEAAKYDVETGYLNISLPKAVPGEFFAGLELLTKLLTPKVAPTNTSKPLIEDISGTDFEENAENSTKTYNDFRNYGFLRQYQGYFRGLDQMPMLLEMIEVDPENLWLNDPDSSEAKLSSKQFIEDRFDPEAFIADCFSQHEDIDPIINWVAWWDAPAPEYLFNSLSLGDESKQASKRECKLAETELEFLANHLPRRIQVFTFKSNVDRQRHTALLLSVLYAYTYDFRTNSGDLTPESAWTIVKLSPVLSTFRLPENMDDLLAETLNRTITFPLYRNRKLFEKCIQDVCNLLYIGRVAVLKALISVANTLSHHEDAWRLAKVWVNDICVWVQIEDQLNDDRLAEISYDLAAASRRLLDRRDLTIGEWPLDLLEAPDESIVDSDQESIEQSDNYSQDYSNDCSNESSESASESEAER